MYVPGLLPAPYEYHKFDTILAQIKTVIEHQGCYWHWCPICHPNVTPEPTSPQLRNILRTIQKDKIIREAVKKGGWKLIEIWEHTTKYCNLQFKI